MDILSVSGLVNYFGKWTDLIEVKVLPILLRKGKSKLAIYGLSHIKDERLSRLFRDGKVSILDVIFKYGITCLILLLKIILGSYVSTK